jgi:hypothetical protein
MKKGKFGKKLITKMVIFMVNAFIILKIEWSNKRGNLKMGMELIIFMTNKEIKLMS